MTAYGMPLAIYADAQAEAVTVVRDGLADRTEPYVAGVQVGGRLPTDRSTDVPRLPFVLCAIDALPDVIHPIVARGTLRVTVWHTTDDNAHDLAQLAHGILLAHHGDGLIGCTPLTAPIRAVDPDTGVDLATFTVRASVKGRLATP